MQSCAVSLSVDRNTLFVSHPVLNSLLHCPFHRLFLYSFTNPRVEFICRIAVIWPHRVMLHTDAQLFLWLQRVSRNDVGLPAKESVYRIVKLLGYSEWTAKQSY